MVIPTGLAYLRFPRRRAIRTISLAIMCTLISLFTLVNPSGASSASAASTARVTVTADQSLGTLTRMSKGLNTAVWDTNLLDSAATTAISNADIHLLRYPGGSTSDVYHWLSNTTVSGISSTQPNNTFDAFMKMAHAADANAIITVDYGAGTPQEAVDWVKYANKGGSRYNGPVPTYAGGSSTGHNYGIHYWEVGNELYGNGTYGAKWEYDTHALGPATYATNVIAFSEAMKAVDPSIHIGAVLTAPGNWPDGQHRLLAPGMTRF